MEKKCNKCSETKSISEFSKNKKGKYGVNNRCKVCDKKYAEKWRSDNPKYMKNWLSNNPEYIKNWALNNSEHHKKSMKNWRLNNPELNKEIIKNWKYKISGVYAIYDNNNTLLYIGQSKQLNGRISSHKSLIKNPAKASVDVQLFYYTLNQCKSVYFTTIEECSPTTLLEREAHYITQLKPLLNKHKNEN
jgi:hypothetical protein